MRVLFRNTTSLLSLFSKMQPPVWTGRNVCLWINPRQWRSKQKGQMSLGELMGVSRSRKNYPSKLSNWMWKKIFFYCFLFMFTFSFEDVSSTVAATKGRNHSADEEEEEEGREEKGEEEDIRTLTSWVFICQDIYELLGSFLFTFYAETVWNNASNIFCVGSLLLWRKVFFFFLIWTKTWTWLCEEKDEEKKTQCVDSSINSILTVCVQVKWDEHFWPAGPTEATFFRRARLLSP